MSIHATFGLHSPDLVTVAVVISTARVAVDSTSIQERRPLLLRQAAQAANVRGQRR